jgi:hypothetical protein|tara:strand:- start:5146 stop:5331 length:186 start_codon:yes stop_codon:yes gene_type:complete
MGGYELLKSDLLMTHKALLDIMPWYSGWLDEDGKPEPHSVMAASVLTMTQTLGIPPKVYIN